MLKVICCETGAHQEMVDITTQVIEIVRQCEVLDGICLVSTPHTTAAITLNENWDPKVRQDLLVGLDHIVPNLPTFRHAEGNSVAHLKASLLGFSSAVPIENGQLVLGRWQGIYLCEFDGPRLRTVHVQVLPGG